MNGQWMGPYSGTNEGWAVADVDDLGTHYQALVFAYDKNPGLPRTAASFKLPKGQDRINISAALVPIQNGTGNAVLPDQIAKLYPNVPGADPSRNRMGYQ